MTKLKRVYTQLSPETIARVKSYQHRNELDDRQTAMRQLLEEALHRDETKAGSHRPQITSLNAGNLRPPDSQTLIELGFGLGDGHTEGVSLAKEVEDAGLAPLVHGLIVHEHGLDVGALERLMKPEDDGLEPYNEDQLKELQAILDRFPQGLRVALDEYDGGQPVSPATIASGMWADPVCSAVDGEVAIKEVLAHAIAYPGEYGDLPYLPVLPGIDAGSA